MQERLLYFMGGSIILIIIYKTETFTNYLFGFVKYLERVIGNEDIKNSCIF